VILGEKGFRLLAALGSHAALGCSNYSASKGIPLFVQESKGRIHVPGSDDRDFTVPTELTHNVLSTFDLAALLRTCDSIILKYHVAAAVASSQQ